ncbi:MAG: FHA domain-containing protein, partial [Bdellovibrio sp. CG10_big_fil_rev_8_21_14_0_10_47_8]
MRAPIILRIFKNNQLVEVKQFELDQVVFGHDTEVSLELKDEAVSPIHCLIELRDSGYYVCDMGSSTGTKKNGKVILDEPISSGDNIEVGPFRIQFFVGAPKPKVAPTESVAPVVPVQPMKPLSPPVDIPTPPVRVEPPKKATPPKLADVKTPGSYSVNSEHGGKQKTFAPPSEVRDLRTYLRPTKGPVVEVIVAWQERVLATYHFGSDRKVNIGSNRKAQVIVPSQVIKGAVPFLELKGGCRVLVPGNMSMELIKASQASAGMDELSRSGKVLRAGSTNALRLDQGELLCLSSSDGALQIFIRYVPSSIIPALGTPLDFTAGELTGLIVSLVIVSLTALYMSVYSPSANEEDKPDEQVRLAQFIYNKPPPPPEAPPKVEPKEAPPPVPKKVVLSDKEKPVEKKGNKESKSAVKQTEAAKASEVRPSPTKRDRPKKFTSIKHGGATKVGETAGANAQSAKDVNKMGLLSAFGGGGVRKQLDEAYSGSGSLLGMANEATGKSGQNDNRAGD